MAADPHSAAFTKPSADTIEARFHITKKPAGDQPKRIDLLQEGFMELAKTVVEVTPPSDEQDRALAQLDLGLFLAVAAISRNEKR